MRLREARQTDTDTQISGQIDGQTHRQMMIQTADTSRYSWTQTGRCRRTDRPTQADRQTDGHPVGQIALFCIIYSRRGHEIKNGDNVIS